MCRDRKWEEYNKSAETKKVYVATKKLLSLKMKQEEGKNYIATMDLLSRQEVKEQYRKNTTTDKFMLQHNEKHKAESLSQQNPLLLRH